MDKLILANVGLFPANFVQKHTSHVTAPELLEGFERPGGAGYQRRCPSDFGQREHPRVFLGRIESS